MAHYSSYALFILLNVLVYAYYGLDVWNIILWNLVVLIGWNFRFVQIMIETLPRDLKGLSVLLAVERDFKKFSRSNSTVADVFRRLAAERPPSAIAFLDAETGERRTFAETVRFVDAVGGYFAGRGHGAGEVAALLAENGVGYAPLWLGLSDIGVVSALLNANLRLEPLAHCVRAAGASLVVVSAALKPNIDECIKCGLLDDKLKIYTFGGADSFLDDLPKGLISSPVRCSKITRKLSDVVLYIFTSGTTGMPKPAVINQARLYVMSKVPEHCFGLNDKDRLYVTMPMYHSAGGVLGAAGTFTIGYTSVIRRKFSASVFWDDCIKYQCTASQYIGEIGRYLLAQPYNENERKHNVKVMYGNGMKIEIWQDFIDRFNVAKIGEIYGCTEGNSTVVNLDYTPGACGFLPVHGVVSDVYPTRLVKMDGRTGRVVRGPDGLCVKCRPGEYGQMVGKIVKNSPAKDFTGYVSREESDRKIIRDVFSKGDHAFASGDILYMNEKGYLFFKDRFGDTFRWKGENVSTVEIEGVIEKIASYRSAIVYGVTIPGHDGRAGAVCISDDGEPLDFDDFLNKLTQHLPSYAIPLFIRFKHSVDLTSTFKYKKYDLQEEGFDLKKCGQDRLYYLNRKSGRYEKLTSEVYEKITSGLITF